MCVCVCVCVSSLSIYVSISIYLSMNQYITRLNYLSASFHRPICSCVRISPVLILVVFICSLIPFLLSTRFYLPVYLSSNYIFIPLSVYLPSYLSIYLSIYLSYLCLSSYVCPSPRPYLSLCVCHQPGSEHCYLWTDEAA